MIVSVVLIINGYEKITKTPTTRYFSLDLENIRVSLKVFG